MKFNLCSALFVFTASLFSQQLQLVSGNGQLVNEQFTSTSRFVVRAVNPAGQPMPGVPIRWALTAGEGTVHTPTLVTDSDGLASAGFLSTNIQPFTSWAQATVVASTASSSVPFTVTTYQGGFGSGQPLIAARVNGPLTGQAGSTIPNAIRVEVVASAGIRQGTGIPNVGIRVVTAESANTVTGPGAQCEGPGGIALTNQFGVVECNLVLNGNPGTLGFRLVAGESFSAGGEQSVTITRPEACDTVLSPANLSFPAAGGPASISVRVSSSCIWTPVSSASWITVVSSGSFTGPGQASFSIAPNTGSARTGLVTIAGATLTVTQAQFGSTSSLTFQPGNTLPSATRGSSYVASLSVIGGQPPYTFSATGLPEGLSVNTGNGVISGSPSAVGRFSIAATVRDMTGATANQTFTLDVAAAGQGASIDISAAFPNGTTGVAYAQTIAVSSTCPNPFSTPRLEQVTGSLPPGLTLQPLSGSQLYQVAGIPTQAGTFRFALRAQDVCGNVTREFTVTIVNAALLTPPMAADLTTVRLLWDRTSSPSPSDEAVLITTGTAPTSFTLTAQSDGNWLTVAPSQGITPSVLAVRAVNIGNLQPGTYNGSITIVSSAPNSPFTIPVTLEIRTPTTATATPAALVFSYEVGGLVPPPQSLSVQGSSQGLPITVVGSTATGLGWFGVTPNSLFTPGTVTVSVNPQTLPVGTYTGTINLLLQGSRTIATVPVTLNVHESGPAVSSIVNGASFLPGPIAPGEIVTIYGGNMGPASLVTFRLTPAGTIDTTLANVRVWFDEQLAPLLHVSAQQITVVAPYSIFGRPTVRVQVENNGARSAIREVPVADSAPALFTTGGATQGAILNQDSTVNGSLNGALAGTIVSLFATGEGQTAPNGVEGAIVPATALARPLLPVNVTVGGRPAEVLYAGSAPGLPAGLMQVNVRLPADTPPGPAPVVLTVGTGNSQPGVTVFIRP